MIPATQPVRCQGRLALVSSVATSDELVMPICFRALSTTAQGTQGRPLPVSSPWEGQQMPLPVAPQRPSAAPVPHPSGWLPGRWPRSRARRCHCACRQAGRWFAGPGASRAGEGKWVGGWGAHCALPARARVPRRPGGRGQAARQGWVGRLLSKHRELVQAYPVLCVINQIPEVRYSAAGNRRTTSSKEGRLGVAGAVLAPGASTHSASPQAVLAGPGLGLARGLPQLPAFA